MATLSKAFYDEGGVVLVHPLGSTVRLGSVGYLENGQWLEITTVKKMFGIDLSIVAGTSDPIDFDAKSGRNLKFETHLQGEVSPLVPQVAKAKARAEVTFGAEGSFILNVKNQTVSQAQELGELHPCRPCDAGRWLERAPVCRPCGFAARTGLGRRPLRFALRLRRLFHGQNAPKQHLDEPLHGRGIALRFRDEDRAL